MGFNEYLVFYKQHEKPASTLYHKYISKNGAKVFSYIAIKLGISPNLISGLSFLFLLLACFFIVTEQLWLSLALLQFSYICDCSDGVVARFTKKSSQFGAYLDILLDRMGGLIVLCTIGYYSIQFTDVSNTFIYVSSLIMCYFYHLSATFRPYYFPELKGYMKKKSNNLDFLKLVIKFLYEFIDSGIFYFIVSVALIFGYINPVVYFYGILSTSLFLANFVFLYRKGSV